MTQRYDKYKDSGVQWLGMIPGHWGCTRLKYITSKIGSGSTPTGGADVYQDSGVIFLRSQNIYNYGLELNDVAYISEEIHQEMKGTHIQSGDILYNITGGSIGRCCLAPESLGEANVNQHVSIVRPKNIENKYLLYSLQSEYCQNQMWILQTGGNREGLSATAFKMFNIPLPPLPEQHAIVSYLDDKCGKIDEWIAQKQKEVELLGEMKQRVIADAVTRGLNPNVKMKATNIPWLPEVPEHWEVRRNKWIFKEEDKKNSDLSYQLLSFSRHKGIIPFAENTDKAPSASDLSKYKILHKGQLLENRMQAWSGMFGCSYIEGCVSPDYSVFSPINGANTEYYAHLYRTPLYVQQFANASKGIGDGFNRLYTTQFNKIYAICPPLSEQRAIVSYITERTAKIDKMVENVNREIENLKEYKQRLISDVVTGQIKVC